ncbi:hypothetical protein [Pelomonas sp. KK5]|uniref:hypothetical protein n=1 Tax=Pelomonas sp. KK5 TaxID=1855730 RepID=UPI00097BAFCE|nr:hypothetical protein [Pelomonas sp. KK5]
MSSDKYLTVKEWQKFAKGRGYKDEALVKALTAAEKAENEGATEHLKVLFELEEQGRALLKLNKGDKKLESYLEDMYKPLKKYRKDAEKAVDKAAERESEEDGDSTAAMQHAMIPLIRAIKKGTEAQALIAVGGKDTAVLLSKKAISPSRREMMLKWLGASGGVRWIKAVCLFEENAHTFVVEGAAAGLAKKLKAALLAQVELRLNVRVRGDDPNDIDAELGEAQDEAEQEESEEDDDVTEEITASDDRGEDADEGGEHEADEQAPDPDKARFKEQLTRLAPLALAALKAGSGDVSRIRAVMDFAREKGEEHNYKAALTALERLDKLLAEHAPPPAAEPPAVDPAAAFNARLAALLPRIKDALAAGAPADLKLKVSEAGVAARKHEYDGAHALLDQAEQMLAPAGRRVDPKIAFTQTRLDWDRARKQVQAELRRLEVALLEQCKDEPDFAEISANTGLLYTLLDSLDERLIDKLDEAVNAEDPAQRQARHHEARGIVDEYLAFVRSDGLLHDIDQSDFVDIALASSLTTQLTAMARQLDSAAA